MLYKYNNKAYGPRNEARDSGKSTITGKGTLQHSKAYTVFKEKIIVNKLKKKEKTVTFVLNRML